MLLLAERLVWCPGTVLSRALIVGALAAGWSADAAASQFYAGLGVSFVPKAEHPVGLLVDTSWRNALGRSAPNGGEIGSFAQLRLPGMRTVELSLGLVGGYARLERSSGAHLALAQIDAEVGGVFSRDGIGAHLALGASKTLGDTAFLPRARGRLSIRDSDVTGGLDLALQGAWLGRVYHD